MELQAIETLTIEGNLNRPSVKFNAETGVLLIEGRSIIENSIRFYEPIVKWLNQYLENPTIKTAFHIKMEYFNTSTSKYLLTMVDKLSESYSEGNEVMVYWYYGDEDMYDLGDDYQNMIDVPFTLIEHRF